MEPWTLYKRVLFDPAALDYPLGNQLYTRFRQTPELDVAILKTGRVAGIPGKNPRQAFYEGKATLVVGVRKESQFASCKPSANFQLPLISGCPGLCEYCYLHTQMGKRPYTRIYVNIEEILARAGEIIGQRQPALTWFEAAATSDPVPVEPLTGALARAIEYFAGQTHGRLRFVTKFPQVDSLLSLAHQGHTRIRYSINTPSVVNRYEHRTPPVAQRLEALQKVMEHDYPSGVIIAPVIFAEDWQAEYHNLLEQVQQIWSPGKDLHFEIISHRFTQRAKNNILEIFPDSTLPMDDAQRRYKFGQFGYGKYIYPPEDLAGLKDYFLKEIAGMFPGAVVDYII